MTEVLSPVILRVAGLPLSTIGGLNPTILENYIARYFAASDTVEKLRPEIEGMLFDLVPTCADDRRLRWEILDAKRAVHGGMHLSIRRAISPAILAKMDGASVARLALWQGAVEEIDEIAGIGSAEVLEEMYVQARDVVRKAGSVDGFTRALSILAPNILEQLIALSAAPVREPIGRRERSILNYIFRSACKTSPLSTLMYSGYLFLSGVSQETPDALPCEKFAISGLDRGLLAAFARKIDQKLADNAAFLELGRSVSLSDDCTLTWTISIYANGKLGYWRKDVRLALRIPAVMAGVLGTLNSPTDRTVLCGRLVEAGMERPSAQKLLVDLMARGVLVRSKHPPKGAASANDLDHKACCRKMRDICRGARRLSALTEQDRLAAARRLRLEIGNLQHVLGMPESEITPQRAISESGRFADVTLLEPDVRILLGNLGEAVKDLVIINPFYSGLCDAFISRFGAHGACHDIMGFLEDFHARADSRSLHIQDRPRATAAKGDRVAVTAYVQVLRGAEKKELVLNQVHCRGIWQSARLLDGAGKYRRALARSYAEWLSKCHAPAEPIEVSMCADVNSLQSHARILRRTLSWGNEGIGIKQVQDVNALKLVVDGVGRLKLFDDQQNEIALAYLGGIVPSPAWGPAFYLTLLSNPHVIDYSFRSGRNTTGASDVTYSHNPRLATNGIILRRAGWTIPSQDILSLLKRPPIERCARLRQLFERRGIPRSGFVNAHRLDESPSAGLPPSLRKPMFMTIDNPLYHDLLKKFAESGGLLSVSEVLPAPDQQWYHADEQAYVSELLVELLLAF